MKTTLSLNEANPLVEADIGGIVLTSNNGKIVCDNTLRARLNHTLNLSLPDVRRTLFPHKEQN